MTDFRTIFDAIIVDPRYQADLDWDETRPGHPKDAARAHIAEIEQNLGVLNPKLSGPDYWKLTVLLHTHDTFKRDSERGVPITHL